MRRSVNNSVIIVGCLICWILAGGTLYAIDQRVAVARAESDLRQVPPLEPPSPTAIKAASLGFTRAAADVVWLSTIQYFGGGNPNERYSALPALLRTIVSLDPDFEYPYLFGGLVLPWQNDARAALQLLDDGQARFPNNGLMPYYAGAIARIQLNDNQRAAAYFQRAARTPGAPPAATLLAGVSLTEADDRQVALAWWDGVVQTATDVTIRDRAIAWRDHLRLILYLEQLIQKEDGQTKPAITSLSDLVNRHILKDVPISPLGLPLRYDAQSKRVELDRS